MKKRKPLLLLVMLLLVAALLAACNAASAPAPQEAKPPTHQDLPATTADHTQFKELKKEFETAPEVTKACLECHNEAPAQVMAGIHWTWEYKDPASGDIWGKKGVINNF